MIFLRFLFLILILSCSTSIGFLLSKKYSDRLNELVTIDKLMQIMKNKIKFTRKPLIDILREISNIKENDYISELFLDISKNLDKKTVIDAWNESIEEKKTYLNLNSEDINLIKSLSSILGKTDIDGQMSGINQFSTLLKVQIMEAEREKNKNAKMYKSLGTIVGLALVIMLI